MNRDSTWRVVPLGDLVLDVQPGFARRPNHSSNGMLQLRTNNISPDGTIDLTDTVFVQVADHEVEKYGLRMGDVIFNNTNSLEWVGKTAFFDENRSCVISNHLTRIRPNSAVLDAEYLALYLHHCFWRTGQVQRWAKRWVSQAAIDQTALVRIEVLLPTHLEQREIVGVLRRASVLRWLRRQSTARVQQLFLSLFYDMFGTPSSWQATVPLQRLVTFVGGGTPDRSVLRYFTGTIPWATSKDVKSRYLNDAQEHITDDAIANSAANLVPGGTILIVVKSKILLHSLPMGIVSRPFCFGQDLKGMICKDGVVPQFIVAALLAQQDRVLRQARGVNTEGLTLDILKSIPMPDVDSSRQERFLQRIRVFDAVETDCAASEETMDILWQSLLGRAFSGELTAAWREKHAEELRRRAEERDALFALQGIASQAEESQQPLVDGEHEVGEVAARAVYAELDSVSKRVLHAACVRPAYFSPEDLNNGSSSLAEIEERLRLLATLGFVTRVKVRGQVRYRVIDPITERALADGLEA